LSYRITEAFFKPLGVDESIFRSMSGNFSVDSQVGHSWWYIEKSIVSITHQPEHARRQT